MGWTGMLRCLWWWIRIRAGDYLVRMNNYSGFIDIHNSAIDEALTALVRETSRLIFRKKKDQPLGLVFAIVGWGQPDILRVNENFRPVESCCFSGISSEAFPMILTSARYRIFLMMFGVRTLSKEFITAKTLLKVKLFLKLIVTPLNASIKSWRRAPDVWKVLFPLGFPRRIVPFQVRTAGALREKKKKVNFAIVDRFGCIRLLMPPRSSS